jgi:hypothetical protein
MLCRNMRWCRKTIWFFVARSKRINTKWRWREIYRLFVIRDNRIGTFWTWKSTKSLQPLVAPFKPRFSTGSILQPYRLQVEIAIPPELEVTVFLFCVIWEQVHGWVCLGILVTVGFTVQHRWPKLGHTTLKRDTTSPLALLEGTTTTCYIIEYCGLLRHHDDPWCLLQQTVLAFTALVLHCILNVIDLSLIFFRSRGSDLPHSRILLASLLVISCARKFAIN